MDDYVTLALLASTAFFVALSFALLRRYRQVSQRISESSELGRNLWETLELRLKKQDERIVDMMAKFDVIQARVMAPPPAPLAFPTAANAQLLAPQQAADLSSSPRVEPAEADSNYTGDVAPSLPVASIPQSQPESQPKSQGSHSKLEETQVAAIGLLLQAPKNTRQITDALRKSREHTARIMKSLFDLGLVKRDDSTKPFVYQLTDEGRRYLSSGT